MANLNHITLLGNLTRDPELRFTASGTPVVSLRLAVNHRYRQHDAWQEEVCYIDCTAFGRLAETASDYLVKGRPVLIEGRLRWRSWEDQDGVKRSQHDVLATNIQFLPRPGQEAVMVAQPGADDVPF